MIPGLGLSKQQAIKLLAMIGDVHNLANDVGAALRSWQIEEESLGEALNVLGKVMLDLHLGIELPIFTAYPELDYVSKE